MDRNITFVGTALANLQSSTPSAIYRGPPAWSLEQSGAERLKELCHIPLLHLFANGHTGKRGDAILRAAVTDSAESMRDPVEAASKQGVLARKSLFL